MIIGISGLTEFVDAGGSTQYGSAGAGKDEVAKSLIRPMHPKINSSLPQFKVVALADPMKRFLMDVFNFSEEQLWGPSALRNAVDERWGISPRKALQQLGTEWGREMHSDLWVRYALRVAEGLEKGAGWYERTKGFTRDDEWDFGRHRSTAIPDMRFVNEMAAIKAAGGFNVRVKRRTETLPGDAATHSSELTLALLPDSDFDLVLDNCSDLGHLQLLTDRMLDIFSGRIQKHEISKEDIPPFKR